MSEYSRSAESGFDSQSSVLIWNWNREGSAVKTVKIAIAVFLAAALSSCVVAPADYYYPYAYYPEERAVYGPPPAPRAYVAPAPVIVEPVVPFVFGGVYIHGGRGNHHGGGHYGGHRR